jgi:hypothetical protein
MARRAERTPTTTTAKEEDGDEARSGRDDRRPYSTPKLVRLGSVRTLMLGASAGLPEGAGTFIKPKM